MKSPLRQCWKPGLKTFYCVLGDCRPQPDPGKGTALWVCLHQPSGPFCNDLTGRYGEKPDAKGFDSLCPLVLLSGTCLWQDMRNWLGMKHFPLKISGEVSSQRSSRFMGIGCVHSSHVCQPAVHGTRVDRPLGCHSVD